MIIISCSRRLSLSPKNSRPEVSLSPLIRYTHWLNIYHRNIKCIYDIDLLPQMKKAGWRCATASKRLDLSLSFLTACTPSLTMGMIDDRAVASRAGKDSNCCMWQPELLPPRYNEHSRVKATST